MNRLLLDKITSLTKGATVSKNKISTSNLQNENHEKAMNNNSLQKQSQKRVRTEEENSDIPNKRNKGKEISHDLEEIEPDITIVNHMENIKLEIEKLNKRMDKLSKELANFKYNNRHNQFYYDTKKLLDEFPIYQQNNDQEIANVRNGLTNLEMKLIQKIRSQEIKINNLN